MARVYYNVTDIEKLPEGTVVWEEHRTPIKWEDENTYEIPIKFRESEFWPLVMYNGIIGNYLKYIYPEELDACDSIRMHTRIWDNKPTDEEVTAEPWPTYEQCKRYWK